LAVAQQSAPQLGSLTDSELKDSVVRLIRSTCYGNCPAYDVTIHGDGRVEYDGKQHVTVMGKKDGNIELPDIKNIVLAFDKAKFFSIKPYTEEACSCTLCTDMPTVITEIQVKGQSHRVTHYYGCRCAPKELWELETAIDKAVRTEQWTGDVSKAG